VITIALAGVLALGLVVSLALFVRRLLLKKRAPGRRSVKSMVWAGIWILITLYWIYWFYTELPLPFAPSFPDFWRTPQVDMVLGVLLAWVVFSLVKAWYQRKASGDDL
jgi:hypothetical protein